MDYDKDFEDDYAQTSFGKIFYKHHKAKGERIVFLHGIGYDSRSFLKLAECLPEKLDVYLMDLLGHGRSAAPAIDYTVEAQARVLKEFIVSNNIDDCYLFGHSYGAWISAYYASQHHQTKGIVLEDSAGIKEQYEDLKTSGRIEEERSEVLRRVMGINFNKEYAMRSMIGNEVGVLDQKTLSEINTRTLIIWGSQDRTVDLKYSKVLEDGIRNAKLVLIERAGHTPHYSHPLEVSDALLDFMEVV